MIKLGKNTFLIYIFIKIYYISFEQVFNFPILFFKYKMKYRKKEKVKKKRSDEKCKLIFFSLTLLSELIRKFVPSHNT